MRLNVCTWRGDREIIMDRDKKVLNDSFAGGDTTSEVQINSSFFDNHDGIDVPRRKHSKSSFAGELFESNSFSGQFINSEAYKKFLSSLLEN